MPLSRHPSSYVTGWPAAPSDAKARRIGKPARQPGGAAAEAVQRLHEALREALEQVVDELGFPPLCLDLD